MEPTMNPDQRHNRAEDEGVNKLFTAADIEFSRFCRC